MEIKYIDEKVKDFKPCWKFFQKLGLEDAYILMDSEQDEKTGEEILLLTVTGSTDRIYKSLPSSHTFKITSKVRPGSVSAEFSIDDKPVVFAQTDYLLLIENARVYIVDSLADDIMRDVPKNMLRIDLFSEDNPSEARDRAVRFFSYFKEYGYLNIQAAWFDFTCEASEDMEYELAEEFVDTAKDDGSALYALLPAVKEDVIQSICEAAEWNDVSLDHGPDLPVNLMVDSGNWNYDLDCDNYLAVKEMDKNRDRFEKSSLLWLAKKLGKEQEWKGLISLYREDGTKALEECQDPVLKSMLEEMDGLMDLGTLTFLVRLPMKDAMNIISAQEEKKGGTITLLKNCVCGLFDPLHGGGSGLGISLEQELTIPVSDIRVSVDGAEDRLYGVDDVYGLVASAWRDPVLVDVEAEF